MDQTTGEPAGDAETSNSHGNSSQKLISTPIPTSFASGRYCIQRFLGEGGQKCVYLGRDVLLDRDVVISLLKTAHLDNASVERMWREARALGRLGDHPHIVTIYDVGEQDGRPYIVTQYLEGGSVADLLERAGEQPLPLDQALDLASQVCEALEYAHARGIVHHDLKPKNIWLTLEGKAKLGDFGIALPMDFDQITPERAMVGTIAYMAPEQAQGQRGRPMSDLYSLGVMLYRMLTGRLPFLGDSALGVIAQHIQASPVAPSWHNPALPQPLENLILRLLAKRPEERPDATAAREILTAIASSDQAAAKPTLRRDEKSLSRLAESVFVGHESQMAHLRLLLQEALTARGRLVLVVGEPGSGKTRTAEQLATYASLRGAQVHYGRCYEGEGAPAFWPWVQLLRSYAQELSNGELRSLTGSHGAVMAQLVPEILQRSPGLPAPPALEPSQARFWLYDSVTALFKHASKVRPQVLILDDLHCADRPSLLLLEFLARELGSSRLLVVGTYRDLDFDRHHPLTSTLAQLVRHGLGERVVLRGLTEQHVARFIEMISGVQPPKALASAVYLKTEGNPFFVKEIVRLLVSEGQLEGLKEETAISLPIPQSVREVLGRRLDGLSQQCYSALAIASVVGREFGLAALRLLTDMSEEELLAVLEEAKAARLVHEVPALPGHYGFSHALIRETLYEDIGATRRVRLHRRIGEALEKIYCASTESHLSELAYHFYQAAPSGDTEKAIKYAVEAARWADKSLAYEEAVINYERAIKTLDFHPQPDGKRRCELLLALGDAQTKAGNTGRAREIFQQAADLARKLGAAEQLAYAALGIGSGAIGAIYGTADQTLICLLEEALSALGDADSRLNSSLMAHLALALYHEPERRLRFSQAAVDMAHRIGDREALLHALYSRSHSRVSRRWKNDWRWPPRWSRSRIA